MIKITYSPVLYNTQHLLSPNWHVLPISIDFQLDTACPAMAMAIK